MRRSLLTVAIAMLATASAAAQSPATPATPLPPTYTDSQATRGQLWYESQCAACHPSRDMSSADFQLKWRGRTAWDLFDRVSNTMPQIAPGSLSRRTYVDIVAYLLRINGVSAGSTALPADTTKLRALPLTFGGAPSTHDSP